MDSLLQGIFKSIKKSLWHLEALSTEIFHKKQMSAEGTAAEYWVVLWLISREMQFNVSPRVRPMSAQSESRMEAQHTAKFNLCRVFSVLRASLFETHRRTTPMEKIGKQTRKLSWLITER